MGLSGSRPGCGPRWVRRWAGLVAAPLVALLAGGCGTGSTTAVPTQAPSRGGTCVARSVTPTTCFHVVAATRSGLGGPVLSTWVGRTLQASGALLRYDLHDCSLPGEDGSELVCTFWPGAPAPVMANLVQRLDDAHLFETVQLAPPTGGRSG
jgi:hypothetical protein